MTNALSSLFSRPVPQTDAEWESLDYRAADVFSPHAPIDEEQLFDGRIDLVEGLVETIFQRGQHAILYGERGVGKTSLCNILKDKIFSRSKFYSVTKRSCTADHDYRRIWAQLFDPIVLPNGLYRTSRGKTVYAVEYEKDGEPVTEVIGKIGKVSLKKARKAALKILPTPEPSKSRPAEPVPPTKRRRRRQAIATEVGRVPVQEVGAQAAVSDEPKLLRRLLLFPELKSTRSIPYTRRNIDRDDCVSLWFNECFW